MISKPLPIPQQKSRLGFHYFPDSLHYREKDLEIWLPKLVGLGANWLVLQSAAERAIPEQFLRTLLEKKIEPVIQFNFSLGTAPDFNSLRPILQAYASWGVKLINFYNHPNSQVSWGASTWSQHDLIDRFIDRFLPFANLAMDCGLNPLFPCMEPGGSFWDTAFMMESLQILSRRKQVNLLENLILTACGWTGYHPLNWGLGGPAKWSTTQPYFTPQGAQDQRGFRCYEWYQNIASKVLGRIPKVLILQAGIPCDPLTGGRLADAKVVENHLALARLCENEKVTDPLDTTSLLAPLPASVLACNFWLLTADDSSPFTKDAWFTSSEGMSASASGLLKWRQQAAQKPAAPQSPSNWRFVIKHYLLLPALEGAPTDWHLDVVRPFIKKYAPTVGYSLQEAAYAARVTVIGGDEFFPEEMLSKLRHLGCHVERIEGSGTSIATLMAER